MKARHLNWAIMVLLAFVSVASATHSAVEAQAETQQAAVPAATGPLKVDERYAAYGFVFEQYEGHDCFGRFSDHELDVLGEVVEAYAGLVGGAERLSTLVSGPVRVRRDLCAVVSYTQAGKVIGLGRGAFDLDVTTASNYYTWGAKSGDELAQVVFGHEVGHRWIDSLRKQGSKDWGDVYGENVWRGERPSTRETWDAAQEGSGADPEEEAVTNLALSVLGRGYRWTFLTDAPATAGRQVWIDGWVSDLVRDSL